MEHTSGSCCTDSLHLVFALSAAREWAYYRVIGLDFIFLGSPSDYTNATLRVLPMSFVAGAVGLVAGRMTFWFVAVSPDPSQSNKEIAERGIRFGYWFSTLMAVGGVRDGRVLAGDAWGHSLQGLATSRDRMLGSGFLVAH